jgi:hypothetical protein
MLNDNAIIEISLGTQISGIISEYRLIRGKKYETIKIVEANAAMKM